MTNRKITIMALIAGIFLGAAATAGFNAYRQAHDSRIFQERLRCKAVAETYVRENSTNLKDNPFAKSRFTLTLVKADYSPARNSCVAELDTTLWSPQGANEIFNVQDLVSRETLFQARCTNCLIEQDRFATPAFDYVIKNASQPRELQEAYYSFEKYMAEQGNHTPDSKQLPYSSVPDAPSMSPTSKSTAPANKPTPSKDGPH